MCCGTGLVLILFVCLLIPFRCNKEWQFFKINMLQPQCLCHSLNAYAIYRFNAYTIASMPKLQPQCAMHMLQTLHAIHHGHMGEAQGHRIQFHLADGGFLVFATASCMSPTRGT